MSTLLKTLRYRAEFILVYVLLFLFRILPVDAASALGGWLGRQIGPRLAVSRKADRHLRMGLPDLGSRKRAQIIRDMWDNLGRIMAEYPHLAYIAGNRVTVKGQGVLAGLPPGSPAVFIGAHLGNWEIIGAALVTQCDYNIRFTYRAPNNPWVDRLLNKTRSFGGQITGYPKSRRTARDLYKAMKDGMPIGIFIDQKFNEGLPVPFFGYPAMTNTAFVALAQKFNAPLIPIQVARTGGAHFELTLHDPVPVLDEAGQALPVEDVIGAAHDILEDWIRHRPAQWLWLHRRWDSALLNVS